MDSLNDFDYTLPKELIAHAPAEKRHQSRLLVYDMRNRNIKHMLFKDIIRYINHGDVFVVNNTKVVKTKLYGKKRSGGKCAITFVSYKGKSVYDVFIQCKNPIVGTRLFFKDGLVGTIVERDIDNKRFLVKFNKEAHAVKDILDRTGDYTLPGYIKNNTYERGRYQTLFAKNEGSIAAPTAGLHFSKELIAKLKRKGAHFVEVCLHIGIGTFKEIEDEDYTKHRMHEERVEVPLETARIINEREGKLIVVGTTVLRAVETATDNKGTVRRYNGFTGLFIYPGYRFKLRFDGMITNFHLPKSSLLLLVASIIGKDWKCLYEEAIRHNYKFYSFGDAMFISEIQH